MYVVVQTQRCNFVPQEKGERSDLVFFLLSPRHVVMDLAGTAREGRRRGKGIIKMQDGGTRN